MPADISHLPPEYHPKIEDLPGDMQVLALGLNDRFPGIGVVIVLALSEFLGGQWVYVRKMKGPMLSWRDDSIRAQYDRGGVTTRELARCWNLSQSSIEKILAKTGCFEG